MTSPAATQSLTPPPNFMPPLRGWLHRLYECFVPPAILDSSFVTASVGAR